jgi:predicted 3-demethylubiquinone-9 3-methyltransferase (glyoxalase superfamily)
MSSCRSARRDLNRAGNCSRRRAGIAGIRPQGCRSGRRAGVLWITGGAAARISEEQPMPKIHPFLWFDTEAEEAMNFYVSLFPGSKAGKVSRYGGPGESGKVMTATFELDGQKITALNGGPHFKFNEAVSFVIDCQDQGEADYYWEKLLEGGQPSQCGWLKDRFGLSWQVVPVQLHDYIGGPDPEGAQRAMAAMLQMTRLDIGALKAAYEG